MKIALYARVSTTDQNAEVQLADLGRYCEVRGWKIVYELVDVGSGADAERPELAKLMLPETLRSIDGVLVWKFDRLFRSVQHMMEALETFRSFDVQFVSKTECLDTSTPAGRMVYAMLAAVAAFERDLIIERTRAGVRNAMAKGKHVGRPRVTFDLDELRRLREVEMLSYRQISTRVGNISAAKIHALLRAPVLKGGSSIS